MIPTFVGINHNIFATYYKFKFAQYATVLDIVLFFNDRSKSPNIEKALKQFTSKYGGDEPLAGRGGALFGAAEGSVGGVE